MANEQDIVFKIKAVMDQSFKQELKKMQDQLQQGAAKSTIGGKGQGQAGQGTLESYLKDTKTLGNQYKVTQKDLQEIKKRQQDLNKTLKEEVLLRKQLRGEIQKSTSADEIRQRREEVGASAGRTKKIQDQLKGLTTGGGGGGMAGMGGLAKSAMTALGVPITAAAFTAAAVTAAKYLFTTNFGSSSGYAKADTMLLAKQQSQAGRSKDYGQLMFKGMSEENTNKTYGASLPGGEGKQAGALADALLTAPMDSIMGMLGDDDALKRARNKVRKKFIEGQEALGSEAQAAISEYTDVSRQRYQFMRETGTGANRDQMYGRMGIVQENARLYGLTEGETTQTMGKGISALGTRRGMGAADTLGQLTGQGFGDIAPGLIAGQSAVGGVNSKEGAERTKKLLRDAMKAGMDDTELAKNLSQSAQAFQQSAAGQFGVAGSGQSADFMNLARLVSDKYGGEMSKENIDRATAVNENIQKQTSGTGGIAGMMKYRSLQEAMPGLDLATTQGVMGEGLAGLTPENLQQKHFMTPEETSPSNMKKIKGAWLKGALAGITVSSDVKQEAFKDVDTYMSGGPGSDEAGESLLKLAQSKRGRGLSAGFAEGDSAKGFLGLQSLLGGKAAGQLGTGATENALNTREGAAQKLDAANTVRQVNTYESDAFQKTMEKVTENTSKSFEKTFDQINKEAQKYLEMWQKANGEPVIPPGKDVHRHTGAQE